MDFSVFAEDVFCPESFEKVECENCNAMRSELDQLEMNQLQEIERTQQILKEKENEISQLKNQSKKQSQMPKNELNDIDYRFYISKIRIDIENLLDCDLPDISKDPKRSINELWMKIRKIIGETSKKLRAKSKSDSNPCQNVTCSRLDLENFGKKLNTIVTEISGFSHDKVYRIDLNGLQINLVVNKEEFSADRLLEVYKENELCLVKLQSAEFDEKAFRLQFDEALDVHIKDLESKIEDLSELGND